LVSEGSANQWKYESLPAGRNFRSIYYFFNICIRGVLYYWKGTIFSSYNIYTFIIGKTLSFKRLKLKCNDFTICVEIAINAKRQNYKYSEINSFEKSRIAGTKKVNDFKDGFLILLYMIKRFFIN